MQKNSLGAKILIFTCTIILILSTYNISAFASTEKSIDYSVNFSIDEKGFPSDTKNIKDWKIVFDKLKLVGNADIKNLFYKEDELIITNNNLLLNDKLLLNFNTNGNQQYFWLTSNSIPPFKPFINMFNFYEFMLKGYFFMGLPTNSIAIIAYPYGAYRAFRPFYNLAYETFYTEKSKTISYEEISEFANKLSSLLDEEHISMQFIRTFFIENGFNDSLYYDLMCFPDYISSTFESQDMEIWVENNKTTYTIADITVFESIKTDEGYSFIMDLPANMSGFTTKMNFDYFKENNAYALKTDLDISIDDLSFFNIAFEGNGLPGKGVFAGEGDFNVSIGGDLYGETNELKFGHSWTLDESESKKSLNLSLDYIHPQTNLPCINTNFVCNIKPFEGTFPKGEKLNGDDFFSLNDESLAKYLSILKPYAKRLVAPLLLEFPKGVINDIWDYMENNGILATLGLN